jgi:hypothetical protein
MQSKDKAHAARNAVRLVCSCAKQLECSWMLLEVSSVYLVMQVARVTPGNVYTDCTLLGDRIRPSGAATSSADPSKLAKIAWPSDQ